MDPHLYPPWILLTHWVVVPSCPNGISDTLRPLTSEWAYTNSGRQANPATRDAVMPKPPVHAFVGINGRSHRPRVFIGFSSLRPRADAGSTPAEGTNEHNEKETP